MEEGTYDVEKLLVPARMHDNCAYCGKLAALMPDDCPSLRVRGDIYADGDPDEATWRFCGEACREAALAMFWWKARAQAK